jgi:hypothetical protein
VATGIRGRAARVTAPRPGRVLGARALAVVRGLPEHSFIDRLVRGRAWIPVLGVLLAGLVAMQVEILKLGTTIGRTMERSAALQGQNESLQARVATLGDDQRIEKLAAAMGMVQPPPSSVVFLSAHRGSDMRRAIANIHAPDPAGFAAQLAAQAAAAAAMMPAAASAATTASSATGAAPATAPTTAPVASSQGPAAATAAATAAPATAGSPTPAPQTASPTVASSAPGAAVTPSAGSSPPATGAAGIAPPGTGQSGG